MERAQCIPNSCATCRKYFQLEYKVCRVKLTRQAYKAIERLPDYILFKVKTWIAAVEMQGIQDMRIRPGFHDEPLKGARQGQRSVRLNKAYRLIYTEMKENNTDWIIILDVNKHDY